jgi:hypothetical protein
MELPWVIRRGASSTDVAIKRHVVYGHGWVENRSRRAHRISTTDAGVSLTAAVRFGQNVNDCLDPLRWAVRHVPDDCRMDF